MPLCHAIKTALSRNSTLFMKGKNVRYGLLHFTDIVIHIGFQVIRFGAENGLNP